MTTISHLTPLLAPHCLALPIYSASFLSPHSFHFYSHKYFWGRIILFHAFTLLLIMFSLPGLPFYLFFTCQIPFPPSNLVQMSPPTGGWFSTLCYICTQHTSTVPHPLYYNPFTQVCSHLARGLTVVSGPANIWQRKCPRTTWGCVCDVNDTYTTLMVN